MPSPSTGPAAWRVRREVAYVTLVLTLLLIVYAQEYLRFLPNDEGRIASDYSLFLPGMLAGYYWFLHNGLLAIPWFSPAQCGGVPYFPDPQVSFYALPQMLTFLVSPLVALQISFMTFAGAGFIGAYGLARISFRTSMPAAMLAGTLFMFNAFYATRLLVGHLTFHAFMLLPLFAAALLPPPDAGRVLILPRVLRVGVAGGCLGYMMQAGMFHILPPAMLSFLIIAGLRAGRFGWRWFPVAGLAAAFVVGLLLSGGKLAASLAFIMNFPRTDYPLPGIAGLWPDIWLAFRTLFFVVPDSAPQAITNSAWAEARHEWEYGVSPVPLVLMLALAAFRIARRPVLPSVTPHRALLVGGLGILLAIPVAVNWYEPAWNAVLKSLPFFGSSSNLLRWFSAYILPAILGGALALDGLCAANKPGSGGRATAATAAMVAVLAWVMMADLSYYGANGTYDVAAIQGAYAKAATTGVVPPIDSVVVLLDPTGRLVMGAQRDDTMTRGHSQMLCYQPIFGYRLEHFPIGTLHPGPALAQSNGKLNFKNPACYTFPKQNGCVPGTPFDVAAEAEARALLDYRPYAFQLPNYARIANAIDGWAFVLWTGMMMGAAAASVWVQRRVPAIA